MINSRKVPIDITPDKFRKIGHELVDRVAELLGKMNEIPLTNNLTPGQIRELLGADRPLPQKGKDPEGILSEATNLLMKYSLYNGHPGFWGYVTSSAAPLGMLGDLLAAAVNPNVGGWQLSPMASEIESQTVRWIAKFLDYPTDCGGLMVSGGNMANFIGFLAARATVAGQEIRTGGMQTLAARPMRIYASVETHTWIQKAADLFGLGTNSIRWIGTDKKQRLNMRELEKTIHEDIQNGERPMIVVGTAGTVSTGAIDPLDDMADFCRKRGIWFHVDGAYGGFAAVSSKVDRAIKGLSKADSVAVDPHKWLYAPLEVGCALVRDVEKIRDAFSYHPPYYHFGEEAINYFDFGLQNSRGFRALKVWLILQQVGREGYVEMIEEDIRLGEEMFKAVEKEPLLEALTYGLSIATFRYIPEDLKSRTDDGKIADYLNTLNEEILVRLKRGGEIFLSNAILGGQFVLRGCIVNFRTSQAHVEAMPGIVVKCGKTVDAELRKETALSS